MITEEQKQEWINKGFDASTLKHRLVLVEAVEKYAPFETILDIGCATGPDVVLYEMAFPKSDIHAFDSTEGDIEIGKKLVTRSILETKDLRQYLKDIPSLSYDIVVSNGVMMYYEPHRIADLLRIAKKAVILSERDPYKFNILDYLKAIRHEPVVTKIDASIRPSWAENGFIYEIKL